jgi:hypothetical protein
MFIVVDEFEVNPEGQYRGNPDTDEYRCRCLTPEIQGLGEDEGKKCGQKQQFIRNGELVEHDMGWF